MSKIKTANTKSTLEKDIKRQIKKTQEALKPNARIYTGCQEITRLIELMFEYLEKKAKETTNYDT